MTPNTSRVLRRQIRFAATKTCSHLQHEHGGLRTVADADDGDRADGCVEPWCAVLPLRAGSSGSTAVEPCDTGCSFPAIVAHGDRCGFTATGRHERAESVRSDRQAAQGRVPWRLRVAGLLRDLVDNVAARTTSRSAPSD
jgi:hypothetical protein